MKRKNNFWKNWKVWVIIVLVLAVLLLLNSNVRKTQELEYSKNCTDDCLSKFELCLDNNTQFNLAQGKSNSFEDALPCLWDEDWCIQNCQMYGYEYWKAMGRIK